MIQKLVMPVNAPMRGGRLQMGNASSDKHYWIAAPFEGFPVTTSGLPCPRFR